MSSITKIQLKTVIADMLNAKYHMVSNTENEVDSMIDDVVNTVYKLYNYSTETEPTVIKLKHRLKQVNPTDTTVTADQPQQAETLRECEALPPQQTFVPPSDELKEEILPVVPKLKLKPKIKAL